MKAYKSGNTYKVFKETQRTYYNSHTFLPKPYLQAYTVPDGVTSIHIDCVGSQGYTAPKLGSAGGLGGRVECNLSVTAGQTLYLMIGSTPSTNAPTMYNASDIRTSNADFTSVENRIIVAGGGGNAGRDDQTSGTGGAGGGLIGGTAATIYQSHGGAGGTQSAGGAGGRSTGSYPLQGHDGSKGYGGYGGYNNLTTAYYGGTGGAGWYGGGGGSMQSYNSYNNAGGGGGSSYTDSSLCSNVIHTQGYQNGNGYITISGTNVYYEDITTYKAFNV